MIANISPVVLFTYKRVKHLKRTIRSLKKNLLSVNTIIYIYSDGPRKPDDTVLVNEVREFLKTITGFKEVKIFNRNANIGLAQSIISGVSQVLKNHDRVIVIEDDLELSPYFLTYMNEALNFYQDNPKIASIHGYTLPVKNELPDTFFLRGADCWGWGTWKRAWDTFEKDGKRLLYQLQDQKLIKQFDFDGLVGNAQMLKDQIAGKNDSWAIRWHASSFLNNMLTLHPGKSLVKNIGLDGSGEHCVTDCNLDSELSINPISVYPVPIEESSLAHHIYKDYYKSIRRPLIKRVVDAIREKM